jgi:hypothetical protein
MEIFMELFLKPVLYLLGSVLSGLAIFAVNAYLIPYLKQKLGDDKYNMLLSYIRMCMSAAEERYPDWDGGMKSEWVIEQIKAKYPSLDNEYVQTLIDGLMQPLSIDGVINHHEQTGF